MFRQIVVLEQAKELSMQRSLRHSTPFPFSSTIGASSLVGGWLVLLTTLGKGPTRAWTLAHLLLLTGWAAYLPISRDLQRHIPSTQRFWSRPAGLLVGLGVPLILCQLLLDFLAAFHATSQADMDYFFQRLLALPQLAIPLYQLAPPLVYSGLLLQSLDGVRSARLPIWTSVLLTIGIAMIAGDQGRFRYRLGLVGQVLCGLSLLRMSQHLARQHKAM